MGAMNSDEDDMDSLYNIDEEQQDHRLGTGDAGKPFDQQRDSFPREQRRTKLNKTHTNFGAKQGA